MPNATAITMHASGAETVDGTSTPITDLADRTIAQLTLDVTAISGTAAPSLAITIEHSLTGQDWATVGQIAALTAVGARQLTLPNVRRYLRASWTITGTGPSVTFSLTGTGHQLYCLPEDLPRYGIPAPALRDVPLASQADSCLSASTEAEGYLASAYAMPMVSWGADLRAHVARMAVYDLMRMIGYDPDSGKDVLIETGRANAIQWLNRIAAGKLRPPGMIDTVPEVLEPEVWVESGTPRGWGVMP
jgi:hypothetical protein